MLTEKYLTKMCKSYYDFKYSLFKVIECMCKVEGLTALQAMMLFMLRSEGELSVGKLSGLFNITQSNASAMCKKLEKDGLIERTRSKSDERTVLLTLSENGNELLARMLDRGKSFGDVLSDISQERLDLIVGTIDEATELLGNLLKEQSKQ